MPEESSNQSSQTLGAASYCLIAYRLCLCHNLQTLPKAHRTQANQSDIFNSSASVFRKREEKSSDRHGKAMIGHVSDKKLSVSGNFLSASGFLLLIDTYFVHPSFIVCVNDRPQFSHNTDQMFRESKVSWVTLQCSEDSDSQLFGSCSKSFILYSAVVYNKIWLNLINLSNILKSFQLCVF